MATIKNFQFPEGFNYPDENQIFRIAGSEALTKAGGGMFGIRKGNQIFTQSLLNLTPQIDNPNIELMKAGKMAGQWQDTETQWTNSLKAFQDLGYDWNSLPVYNYGDAVQTNLTGLTSGGTATLDMLKAMKSASIIPGGTTSLIVDPNNPNKFLSPVAGEVPTSQLAPANYLQNLLGGQYMNTPAQAQALYPSLQNEIASRAGATPAGSQRTLINIANSRPDVLATAKSQGGDPFTAGTPANTWLNDWWNNAGKNEYPGVTLSQPSNATPGGTGAGTGATGGTTDPKDAIIKSLMDANKALQSSSGGLQSAYKTAQEAAGINKGYEQVGTFDQEIQKTQSLLDDLANKVSSGQAIEEARLAPMDIIRSRQEAVAGAVEPTRQGLLKTLGLAQTGRSQLLEELRLKNQDILSEMGLKEKDLANLRMDSQIIGTAETGYYQVLTDKDGNVVKTTELVKGTGTEKYSEPYLLGGDWVQRSDKTGLIKTAVNMPASTTTNTWTTTLGIAAKDATKFNDEFQRQYERVLGGTYGTEGAREKAGQAMLAQFPQYADAIWKVIYGKPEEGINAMFPNGYESQIKQSSSTQVNIPQWQYDLGVRPGMTEDQKNAILNQNKTVTNTMAQMKSVFQQYKDAGWSKADAQNEWKKQNSADSIPGAIQDLFNEIFGKNWLGQ